MTITDNSVPSHPFPWIATVVCIMGVVILLGLGVWQVQRLAWKNHLQQQLDTAFAVDAVLPLLTERDFQTADKSDLVRGTLRVEIDPAHIMRMQGRVIDGKQAVSFVVPARSPQFKRAIMVEIGCAIAAEAPVVASLKKEVTLTGLVRTPKWSYFTPPNKPDAGSWWRLDASDVSKVIGYAVHNRYITIENTQELTPALVPCPIEKTLKNDHASYALFWFAMSGVLVTLWGLRFFRPYLQSA